ncbi:MAG: tetratricopeptide repeat protein, partial [Oscillospiraceae bacterium]|nr:tetratricopeptide repeat protein [Oscillospiraceae bacterium]
MTIAVLIPYRNFAAKTGRTVGEYTASIDSLIFLGDYGKAVSECTDGLRHYPENAELYILKARAYMLSGDTVKAIGTLDYGYKQTQSGDILEQREKIAEAAADDAGFI